MIFIPYNVPSGKNNREVRTKFTKTGKRYNGIVNSEAYKTYKNNSGHYWNLNRKKFQEAFNPLPKPCAIALHFIKSTKQSFDFIGPCETIQDVMQLFGWIPNDDFSQIFTIPLLVNGRYYSVDKKIRE